MNDDFPALTAADFAAYLHALGYDRPPPATLATLRALQLRHVSTFAFESVSPLLGLPVRLDLPALMDKLLRQGRGGYCYELNLAYQALLRELGFQVEPLTGRVLMGAPAGRMPARTHLLALVRIDGRDYVSDVGFGGMVPTSPLHLDSSDEQPTEHEPYRLREQSGTHTLQARVEDEWRDLYAFDLQRQHPADLEVGNWYVSTHPDSPFRKQLIAARVGPGLRRTLSNGSYAVHRIGAPSQRRQLADADEVIGVLRDAFGVNVPEGDAFRAAVTRLLAES